MEPDTHTGWRSPVRLAWPALVAVVASVQMVLADTTFGLALAGLLLLCAVGMGYEAVRPRRRRPGKERHDD